MKDFRRRRPIKNSTCATGCTLCVEINQKLKSKLIKNKIFRGGCFLVYSLQFTVYRWLHRREGQFIVYSLKFIVYRWLHRREEGMVYCLQFTVYRWLHRREGGMVYSLQFKFLRPFGSKRQSRAYRWLHRR